MMARLELVNWWICGGLPAEVKGSRSLGSLGEQPSMARVMVLACGRQGPQAERESVPHLAKRSGRGARAGKYFKTSCFFLHTSVLE